MTVDWEPGEPKFEVPGMIPAGDKFRLQTGLWYKVRLSVRVNDNDSVKYVVDQQGQPVKDGNGYLQPLSGNGEVSLAIASADGSARRLLVFPNVALRDECNGPCPASVPDSRDTWVNAVFFSTFFGGNETKRTTCIDLEKTTLTSIVPAALPVYPGLTQPTFEQLCATQMNAAIYPKLTWSPQTPSAVRFDNIVVRPGYTSAPL